MVRKRSFRKYEATGSVYKKKREVERPIGNKGNEKAVLGDLLINYPKFRIILNSY